MNTHALCGDDPVMQKPRLYRAADGHIRRLEQMHADAEDLVAINRLPDAVRAYEDILMFEPDDETAYTNLGYVCMTLGYYKKAHECFDNALSVNPDNESAAIGIQKILDPDGVEGMVIGNQVEGLVPLPAQAESMPLNNDS